MIKDNLHTITVSLFDAHLGLALEALYRIRENDIDRRSKNAISIIIHSYCGLESAVNFIGYQLFFDPESTTFIKEQNRDLPLKRMVNNWHSNLSCLDEIEYILSVQKVNFPAKLKNEIAELNNMRNWLAHGFSYKTTFLLEPKIDEENTYNVIDSEDNIDWQKKFPNTKFSPITDLNGNDGEKALRIVLETLVIISAATNQPFHVVTYYKKPNYSMIYKDTNIDKIISPK